MQAYNSSNTIERSLHQGKIETMLPVPPLPGYLRGLPRLSVPAVVV